MGWPLFKNIHTEVSSYITKILKKCVSPFAFFSLQTHITQFLQLDSHDAPRCPTKNNYNNGTPARYGSTIHQNPSLSVHQEEYKKKKEFERPTDRHAVHDVANVIAGCFGEPEDTDGDAGVELLRFGVYACAL